MSANQKKQKNVILAPILPASRSRAPELAIFCKFYAWLTGDPSGVASHRVVCLIRDQWGRRAVKRTWIWRRDPLRRTESRSRRVRRPVNREAFY